MQQQRDDGGLDKCKTQPEVSLVQGVDTSKLQLHSRQNLWVQPTLFLTKIRSLRMFSHFWPRSRHYSYITMGERREDAEKKAAHPTHKTFTAFDLRAISVCQDEAGRSVSLWKMYEWVTGAWYSQTVKGGADRSSLGWDKVSIIKKTNNNKTETRFRPERMNQSVCHHSESRQDRKVHLW